MKKTVKGLSMIVIALLIVLCITAGALADADTTRTGSRVKILSQPSDITVGYASNVYFTVSATGDGLTYQWLYMPGSGGWRYITTGGGNSATLYVSANATMNGYQYRCIVKDAYRNSVYSDIATLRWSASYTPYIAPQITAAPQYYTPSLRIVTQPVDQTVRAGTNVTFTTTAEGDGVTYLWQMKAPGSSWAVMGNASQNGSWTLYADASMNGYQYRCIVTDRTGAAIASATATLTVSGTNTGSAPIITLQPLSTSVNRGAQANFYLNATGNGLNYQWQVLGPSSSWTNVIGARTAGLSVYTQAGMNGYWYRCVIVDASGNAIVSAPVILTVY